MSRSPVAPTAEFAVVLPYPDRSPTALWWRYVVTVTGGAAQKDIAEATGSDQSSISRWQNGSNKPSADAVVALARAYRCSPVEALVAAGYLASGEHGVADMAVRTGDLTGASVDSLLFELRRRLVTASPHDAQSWPAGWATEH